ncbi:hypothetical protein FKP32DRAFT_1596179 [Trametes sanguinea]|nr:hypothetical protein FKP32DRAFT_1596179 [Trametes sanguinea]
MTSLLRRREARRTQLPPSSESLPALPRTVILSPPCPHPSGSQEADLVICLAVVIVACAVWLPAACGAGPVARLYEMDGQTQVPSSVPGVPMSDGIVVRPSLQCPLTPYEVRAT